MIGEKHVAWNLLEPFYIHLVVHSINLEGQRYQHGFVCEPQIENGDPMKTLIEEPFPTDSTYLLKAWYLQCV